MTNFVPRGRHLFVYDLLATIFAIGVSFDLRFDALNAGRSIGPYLPVAFLPLLIMPLTYAGFGLYRREWRYASVHEMLSLTMAVIVGSAISAALVLGLGMDKVPGTVGFPRSVFVIQALLDLGLIGGGRFAVQIGRAHV
jgi:FlaA1/EpsC-like NDP-sugar epimerase